MLIDVSIAQSDFEKVYKGKVMDDTGNEREVIVKMPLQANGSTKKNEIKMGEIIKNLQRR
jgi:hypothetical protein